jgi:hypothetical protein
MSAAVKMIIGAVIGAAVGYAMYRFTGCRTGACPLSANPYIAMLVWGAMGALVMAGK